MGRAYVRLAEAAGGRLNIAEVLDLSVEDAVGFFDAGEAGTPAAHAMAAPAKVPAAPAPKRRHQRGPRPR